MLGSSMPTCNAKERIPHRWQSCLSGYAPHQATSYLLPSTTLGTSAMLPRCVISTCTTIVMLNLSALSAPYFVTSAIQQIIPGIHALVSSAVSMGDRYDQFSPADEFIGDSREARYQPLHEPTTKDKQGNCMRCYNIRDN